MGVRGQVLIDQTWHCVDSGVRNGVYIQYASKKRFHFRSVLENGTKRNGMVGCVQTT